MMDREDFGQELRDALVHLYDLPYLHNQPLATFFSDADEPLSGDEMHRLLVGAIEDLKPPSNTPVTASSLRHYKCLSLRYLQGATPETVARQIGVSPRQARRDHLEAVQSLANYLWAASERKGRVSLGNAPLPAEEEDDSAEDLTPDTSLENELQHLGTSRGNTPADLSEVLRDALSIVGGLTSARGIAIESTVPAGLPPISLDRVILRQVLVNVLGHAAENARGGSAHLSASRDGRRVSLEICLEKQPTAPAHGEGGNANQSAALLSTGQRILEAHGGTLLNITNGSMTNGNCSQVLSLSFPTEQVATILVIDDNPDVARLFRRYLRGRNFAVIQASTGQKALQIAQEEQPDVVTLDLLMPSVDGWDVLRHLRSTPATQSIPVVVCSILPDKDVALLAGATAFLSKPITQGGLIDTLEPLVSLTR